MNVGKTSDWVHILLSAKAFTTDEKPHEYNECGKAFCQNALFSITKVSGKRNPVNRIITGNVSVIAWVLPATRGSSHRKYLWLWYMWEELQSEHIFYNSKEFPLKINLSVMNVGRHLAKSSGLNIWEFTSERNLICIGCGVVFSHSSAVTQHQKNHTIEKPY